MKKMILAWLLVSSCVTAFANQQQDKHDKHDKHDNYWQTQRTCLQRAILAEARGTDKATMQAVADVIVNRAKQQKKSVCVVLRQKNQFAKLHPVPKTDSKNQSTKVKNDIELSSTIAASALANGSKNKQILFFHTSKKRYAWTKKLRLVKQDKWHRYYAEAD